MKHVPLLVFALASFLLISETHGEHSSNFQEELKRDLVQAGSAFKCPLIFGTFPDPDDCQHFYICIAGSGFRKKCSMFLKFDILTRRCLPALIATCGTSNKGKSSTPVPSTTVTRTTEGDSFVCTSFTGQFPHPNDCSKYYSCFFYRPTAKTCPKNELFDAVKKACQPEDQVHCGTRQRPIDLTTVEIPDITTDGTTEETDVTPDKTDATTDQATDSTITESVPITTTEIQPTGPPDHDCDENDLDCIIDETGDANDWFRCPEDVGSYPHPSSDKLFIFCMNWIPSVKKCGLDLYFSKELMTCTGTFL